MVIGMSFLKSEKEGFLLQPFLTLPNDIISPFFNQLFHVIWQFTFKQYFFSSSRVNETNRFGMKGLTGANLKAIVYKLLVFVEDRSFHDPVTSVSLIIEQRMSDMLHVHANLVCAPCFQYALNQAGVAKSLNHLIMGNCFFPIFAV